MQGRFYAGDGFISREVLTGPTLNALNPYRSTGLPTGDSVLLVSWRSSLEESKGSTKLLRTP